MAFTQIGGVKHWDGGFFGYKFAFFFIILCFTLHLHLTFGLLTVFLLKYDVII